MKVALLYSGMFRGFNQNIENHVKHLISKYDCDIYLNFWDVQGWGGVAFKFETNPDIEKSYQEKLSIGSTHPKESFYEMMEKGSHIITDDDIKSVKEQLVIKQLKIDDFKKYESEIKEISDKIQEGRLHQPYVKNIMSMYESIKRCYQLVDENVNYDVVVKLRSDIIFLEDLVLKTPEPNTIYHNLLGSWQNAPNDGLIYGDNEIMKFYHKLPDELLEIWEKYGGHMAYETILQIFSDKYGIKLSPEIIQYKFKRLDGQLV
jgi:hypothetical protein